jgi:uncharacterized damage-inducible protein DinB
MTGAVLAVAELLVESFARNGRVNLAVLDVLSAADLSTEDGPDGNSVGDLLSHMAGFRRGWLSNISPAHADGLAEVNAQSDLQTLRAAFSAGDAAALKAVQDALQEGRAFADPWKEGAYQSNPAHFLQHTIVHDSHHRGQIATLLRQSGRSKEQMDELEEATWPVWRA